MVARRLASSPPRRGARGVRAKRFQRPKQILDYWTTTHTIYTPELQVLSAKSYSATARGGETTTAVREIVWFGGTPVAQLDGLTAPRTLRYTFTDHLGTPLLQTNSAGQIVWRAEYDPYGTIIQQRAGTSTDQPLRFPGQEVEDGSDLYQNVFKWYRPGWGRYTQADPMGSAKAAYMYAGGNPTGFFDRLGLMEVSVDPTEFEETELINMACNFVGGNNPFSSGAGLKGCTVFKHLSITCHCTEKGPCGWYPEIAISAGLKVWYDPTAVQVDPPYKLIPPELIVLEEMKHVKVALGMLLTIEQQGDSHGRAVFRTMVVLLLVLCCCSRREQPRRPVESSVTESMFSRVQLGMSRAQVGSIMVGRSTTLTGNILREASTRDGCPAASEAHYYYRNLPRASFTVYMGADGKVNCKATSYNSIAY